MAGRFSVEAVFKAKDRITAPVSRMQNRVGKFTRAISRGLRTANRHVDRLVRGMGRGIGRVARFGGALAAVGAAAVVTALDRTAASADALAKQARRLQFPIEDLQEWKFVAEQSGVSNELLDKSLGAFSKRLGEAKSGMGPLVSGLKDLNPELLSQLQSTDDISKAFGMYIDAIREADTATEKAALANAAFSRSGLNLVNIADNSSDAIAGLRLEQRENGNITMQQAEAAEAYGDAVNSLKRGLMGLMHQVLLPMMPMITENVRKWREWIVANREMLQTRIIEFVKNLWHRMRDFTLAVIEFNKRYDIGDRLAEGLDVLGRFGRYLSENAGTIVQFVKAAVILVAVLKGLAFIMAVVNFVMAANPVTWIVVGVVALIAGLILLGFWLWSIRDTLIEFAKAIKDRVVAALNWLMDTFLSLPAIVQVAIAFILGPIGWLIAAAVWITESWGTISGFFSDLWADVTDAFNSAPTASEGILAAFVAAASAVMDAWEGVGAFFADLWAGIIDTFNGALSTITNVTDKVKNAANAVSNKASEIGGGVANFFGFGEDEDDEGQSAGAASPLMLSPQERTARSIEETRTSSASEVTIRDETGRAETTRGPLGNGLTLLSSGAP